MSENECRNCGLAACDLPDGVDPAFIFEDGLCQGCATLAANDPTVGWPNSPVWWNAS